MTFDGELNSAVRTHKWTQKNKSDRVPPILRFIRSDGEISPLSLNLSDEEPIPLEGIYGAKQVDIINKLSDLIIALDKEQIPIYRFTQTSHTSK